jgi:hypothetical protein
VAAIGWRVAAPMHNGCVTRSHSRKRS